MAVVIAVMHALITYEELNEQRFSINNLCKKQIEFG